MQTIRSCSTAETETAGSSVAKELLSNSNLPHFIALYGDLGVGKTAFVRGFTKEIAPASIVRSPTFALVNEYSAKPLSVFHFDMYRIEDEDDLYSIGFYDYLNRPGICLVEWSEKIPFALPDDYFKITITKFSPDFPEERNIIIERIGGENNENIGN